MNQAPTGMMPRDVRWPSVTDIVSSVSNLANISTPALMTWVPAFYRGHIEYLL